MDVPATLMLVYLIGVPVAWILCSLPFVGDRSGEDIAEAVGIGLCVALAWPLVPPALLVFGIVKALT